MAFKPDAIIFALLALMALVSGQQYFDLNPLGESFWSSSSWKTDANYGGFGEAYWDSVTNRTYYAAAKSIGYTNSISSNSVTRLDDYSSAVLNSTLVHFRFDASQQYGWLVWTKNLVLNARNLDTGDKWLNEKSVSDLVSSTYGSANSVTSLIYAYVGSVKMMVATFNTNLGVAWLAYTSDATNPNAPLTGWVIQEPATNCYTSFFHAPSGRIYWGCSGSFIVQTSANRPLGTGSGSATKYLAGAGNYISGAITSDRLYLGSTIGLGIVIELDTNTVKQTFFLFGVGQLTSLNSVWVDTAVNATFWGSGDGRVARVNRRDFRTVFGVPVSSGLTSPAPLSVVTAGMHNGNQVVNFHLGIKSTGKLYRSFQLVKSRCSTFTCSQCKGIDNIDVEYCGFCPSTSTCTTQSSCNNAWSQSGPCPAGLQEVSQNMTGAATGGTISTLVGTYFDTTPGVQYFCTYFVTGSTPKTVPMESGSLTATSIQCKSPDWTSVPANGLTVSINVTRGTNAWASGWTFEYYDCIHASSCQNCGFGVQTECRWCFHRASCTTRAACTVNAGATVPQRYWDLWTPSRCPVVSPVQNSASYSVRDGIASVTVPVSNFPAPTADVGIRCSLQPSLVTNSPYYQAIAPLSGITREAGNTDYITSLTCPINPGGFTYNPPNSPHFDSIMLSPVLLLDQTGATAIYGVSEPAKVELFECDKFLVCATCTAPAHAGKCQWCGKSDGTGSCTWTATDTCPPGSDLSAICSTISSISPSRSPLGAAPNRQLTISASSVSAATDLCYFTVAGGASQTTPLTQVGEVTYRCNLPATIAEPITYQIALGSSAGYSTNFVEFVVYSCAARTGCTECTSISGDECSWCYDIDTPACIESAADASVCSTNRVATGSSAQCPTLTDATPTQFPMSGASNVSLMGTHKLTEGNSDRARCLFNSTEMAFSNVTTLTYISETELSCDSVPSTDSSGLVTIAVVNDAEQLFTNFVNVSYVTCSQFTDCGSCLGAVLNGQPFCGWCGASCVSTCSDPALSAATCPTISSISPSYAIATGGDVITIYGTGFLVGTGSSSEPTGGAKRSDASSSSSPHSSSSQSSGGSTVHSLSSEKEGGEMGSSKIGKFGTKFGSISSKFSSSKKRSALASGFTCSWDAITETEVVVESSTQMSCVTPARGLASVLPLTIKFNGNTYLTTPGIEFFKCEVPVASVRDFCTSQCASRPHCGWCVGTGSCSSQYQCETVGGGIWQSITCPSARLTHTMVPVQGKVPLVATLTQALPEGVTSAEVQCSFGSVNVASSVRTTGNATEGTLSTQVSCTAPAVASPTKTSFGVLYRGEQFIAPVNFAYDDCSVHSSCTQCISSINCGWCSKGNKCMFEMQCPGAGSWSKVKCPINKVALGVGLTFGLLFLVALILIAIFLIRRARKKRGLVITVREPDYNVIAWGTDTTLWWKVPEHRYKLLDTALSRKDFLLQVAMSFNCPATEQDALAKAMVYVAHSHGIAAELIQTVIRYEVQTCKAENTLFRNNSVASKMYKFFSRIVGIKYLFNCIARVIMELEVLGRRTQAQGISGAHSSGGSGVKSGGGASGGGGSGEHDPTKEVSLLSMTMELDQTKALGDDIDTDTNLLQLQLICQKLLNVIIKKSIHNIPAEFRKIFIEIDNSVMGRFAGSNDAVYKGIGGLFFLRFVCPAITAPHVYGLLEAPPNPVTQRQLVLITKVIQTIANMQEPGKKEEYMVALAGFIRSSIPKIVTFYDNLRMAVNLPTTGSGDTQDIEVPDEVKLNGLAAIWNFLYTESPKIKPWINGPECPFEEDEKEATIQEIEECMREYPAPPKKLKHGASDEIAAAQGGGKKKKKNKA